MRTAKDKKGGGSPSGGGRENYEEEGEWNVRGGAKGRKEVRSFIKSDLEAGRDNRLRIDAALSNFPNPEYIRGGRKRNEHAEKHLILEKKRNVRKEKRKKCANEGGRREEGGGTFSKAILWSPKRNCSRVIVRLIFPFFATVTEAPYHTEENEEENKR